ncbi:sugar-binding domain-containing protein [Actinotignum urinale]|uniref:sugar-binding transcriptional regulator n=1 Tax=Actinotignum urinale TaxID=190146 RepID=UPI000C7F8548|nr:sugar-binding domain-containing protein [Actinotignum urinale]WIK59299.1 sugar-binding domain-containing protein [Actinotignum urinale]
MFNSESTVNDRKRFELLLTVAKRYYLDDAKQSEIAQEIGYSRVTVSRLLAEAKRCGMVHIEISHPHERLAILEKQISSKYRIKEVRVSPASATDTESTTGKLAAELLLTHCSSRATIAISNGRAVAATVPQLPRRHWFSSCVVPILGMAGGELPFIDSPELCRNMAKRLGGNYWTLPVPLVFETELTALAMRQEPSVSRTLDLAARADAALVGVGSAKDSGSSPILRKWITPTIQREIQKKHAVAHLCGHYIDATGNHVDTTLCRRTVCLEPGQLRKIPFVVAVAYGEEKVDALRAILTGRYVDALVTDEYTALALIENYNID